MSNIINLTQKQTKFKESRTTSEIIKTVYLYAPSENDLTFLSCHSNFIDDSPLCDDIGESYLFSLKVSTIYNPIEAYTDYLKDIGANKEIINQMTKAKSEGATMIIFTVINNLDFMKNNIH